MREPRLDCLVRACRSAASFHVPTPELARDDPDRIDSLAGAARPGATPGRLAGAEPVRVELLIPPDDGKHAVALWLEAEHGDASLRWLGPGGEVVTDWRGRRLEQRATRALAPGKHVIEIRPGGARVHGLIGVKGAVVERCAIDGTRVTGQAADAA